MTDCRTAYRAGCLSLFLLLSLLSLAAVPPPDCAALLEAFMAQPDWMAPLVDPLVNSQAEIDAAYARYESLHTCLQQIAPDQLSAAQRLLYRLTGYYLVFAGGYDTPPGSSSLRLVDLAGSSDPALVQLRQDVQLAPPPGLVFVRFYRSRQHLPALLQEVFADPNIMGVTVYSRYVAVIDETRAGQLPQQMLASQALPVTVSHELVHAYLHAALGAQRLTARPDWYAEGLAIYFSGSGREHTVILFGSDLRQSSPQEYRQYENAIRFLEARLGRPAFLRAVRDSVEQNDPALLYRQAGFEDEKIFLLAARGWQEQRTRQVWLLLLPALAALPLLAWRFWPRPTATCDACHYVGHPDEFNDGWCPVCGAPYINATDTDIESPTS